MKKVILDATCGSKMMWFDKKNPLTIFTDIRELDTTLVDGRRLLIKPDAIVDFRDMPYEDNSFKLVVFDPPHLETLGATSWMAKKYGVLNSDWRKDITLGFSECFRVLDEYGVLVFKWSEDQVSVKEVLKLAKNPPLFGHTTGRSGKTKWIVFMKVPEE